jgi:hypothetical protein
MLNSVSGSMANSAATASAPIVPAVIASDTMAHLIFTLYWDCHLGSHQSSYHVERFNVWRDLDLLPQSLRREIDGQAAGHRARVAFDAGEIVPHWRKELQVRLARSGFPRPGSTSRVVEPMIGRFYPAGWVGGVAGVFSDNFQPARLVAIEGEQLVFDLNHPLARVPLTVEVTIVGIEPAGDEHGGRCSDPLEGLCRHPGFEAALDSQPNGYGGGQPFARIDEGDDGLFYAMPRRVHHLDSHARGVVNRIYRERIGRGSRLLDLMAGWASHLDGVEADVVGLGMNREEMEENCELGRVVVQDLNRQQQLPFADGEFDAVVCCASIEYLVKPQAVLAEIRRLLRPGGELIITFSNRWFPTKAISIWSELHEFERPAMVRQWLAEAGFVAIGGLSEQGHSRPEEDPHIDRSPLADPLFAVWGRVE